MKSILKFTILTLTLAMLCSCGVLNFAKLPGEKEENDTQGVRMTAEIIAISDRLEVEVISGEYGASGTYWVITSDDTPCFDSEGNTIKVSDLEVGDKIEIIYGGQVMMSYPPQIVAKKIQILK